MIQTAETIFNVLQRISKGERVLKIARELKVSSSAVNYWRKYGGMTIEQIDLARKRIKGGTSQKIIITEGQKIGMLTAINPQGKKYNEYMWKFRCDCGNEVIASKTRVVAGCPRSCGCLRKKIWKQLGKL